MLNRRALTGAGAGGGGAAGDGATAGVECAFSAARSRGCNGVTCDTCLAFAGQFVLEIVFDGFHALDHFGDGRGVETP